MKKNTINNKGFTLIEIVSVVVIIGIIIVVSGAVVTGYVASSVIEAPECKETTGELVILTTTNKAGNNRDSAKMYYTVEYNGYGVCK